MKCEFIVRGVSAQLGNNVPGMAMGKAGEAPKVNYNVTLTPVTETVDDKRVTLITGELHLVANEDLGYTLGQRLMVTVS